MEERRVEGALAVLASGVAVLLSAPNAAWSQSKSAAVSNGLYQPVRMTAGASNQWMGALTAETDALYFVSDRNATREIFVQKPVDSGPRLLFSSKADVSWPRPSPDGSRLAYISYRSDATGDLCVLTVADGRQRCLSGPKSAEMQPVWLDDGRALGALLRTSLHGNYQLRRFAVDGPKEGEGKLLLERNMLGVAVSRDGRWLAYVPVRKTERRVGVAFANRSGQALMLQRLDQLSKEPVSFSPDLPGLTGFPAFSADGRYLYFSQYLNDTNGDGDINGDDHSVLFRVPFDGTSDQPLGSGTRAPWPRQLTSAQWNCRYPVPATGQLIMTCARDGSLDVYSLPLTGAVPEEWDAERVRAELHVARNHWTKLLLSGRLLELASAKRSQQLEVARTMTWLHVELREYESATFYAKQVERLAIRKDGAGGDPSGDGMTRWGRALLELAHHRQRDIELTHGQLSDTYLRSERKRVARLQGMTDADGTLPPVVRLVVGEILADLGDKAQAETSVAGLSPADIDDPLVLELYAQRARAVHGLRADRSALLDVYRQLAAHQSFDTLARLRYAEEFVAELFRGQPVDKRPQLVNDWVSRLPEDSELVLMLQIAGWLLDLSDERQEEVRKGIYQLYRKNKQPDRRRALVLATVRTAGRLGNEYLQYQFMTSWASFLRRAEPERKHAEELYRQIVLERAYTELDKQEVAKARASFYAATVQTTSLEAHIGFVEARMQETGSDVVAEYAKRFKERPDDPAYAFVQGYLGARSLPTVTDDVAYGEACKVAIEHLRRAAKVWPRSMEIEHVWGTILHRRDRRLSSKEDALDAHAHYLLALDLAQDNVRFRAALLTQLGLLQAELGNHRMAYRYFEQRAGLPNGSARRELSLRVAMARSAYHANRLDVAVEQIERAVVILREDGSLSKYRPLVLDRAGFYHQAANKSARALEHYQELIPLLDRSESPEVGAPINHIKARLGAAVAALASKQYAVAVQRIDELESRLAADTALRVPTPVSGITPRQRAALERDDYRLLLLGLLAHAHRGREDYAAAERTMTRRYQLIKARLDKRTTDDDLSELARISHHMAEYNYRAGQPKRARSLLERGLRFSDRYDERTGSEVNPVGLRLLQAYAELHLYGEVALASYQLDLRKRLEQTYAFICERRSPRWQAERFLFGLYLAMLDISK